MTSPGRRPRLELRAAPHAHAGLSVEQIMRNVVFALLPLCGYAVFKFGVSAAVLMLVVTAACLGTEWFFSRLSGKPNPLGDWSATITGLLLALTLPPGFPLWMGAVAGMVAIGLGKALFGGLGYNVFNPALVGRAFVQAAFPGAITTWTPAFSDNRFTEFFPTTLVLPLMQPPAAADWLRIYGVDAFTGATPLALYKFEGVLTESSSLFLGLTSGSAGETSALLILLCGGYLALRRMLDWRIPVAVLGSAFLAAEVFHAFDATRFPPGLFMVLSGGLMLGAVFMATDMVGSPVTPLGVWLYGALIGVVTILIRLFGGLPEGVMYAILLGNALSPLIDQFTQPRVYGARGKKART